MGDTMPETEPEKSAETEKPKPEKTAESASLDKDSTNPPESCKCTGSNIISAIAILMASFAIAMAVGFGTQLNIRVQEQQKTIDILGECLSIHQNTSDELEQLKRYVSILAANVNHSTATLPAQSLDSLSDRVTLLENRSRDHLTDLINNHGLWVNDTVETLIQLYEQLQILVDENTQEIRYVDNTTRDLLHTLESTLRGAIRELASASYGNFTQLQTAIDELAGSVDETNSIVRALQKDITNITTNVTQLRLSTISEFMLIREDMNSEFESIREDLNSELATVRDEQNYDSELAAIRTTLNDLSREVNDLKSGAQTISVTNVVVFILVPLFIVPV